jgi:hypothetical protein
MISTSSKKRFVNNKCSPIIPPTIVLLGYCHSLWNTPCDKMVNHVPFFWPLPFLETTQPFARGWVIQFLFLFPKWKSTPTFAVSRVMRPFHATLVMQHICLFPREWWFIFLLIPWMKVYLAFSIPQVNHFPKKSLGIGSIPRKSHSQRQHNHFSIYWSITKPYLKEWMFISFCTRWKSTFTFANPPPSHHLIPKTTTLP